jgi:YVTN family beta-propeller protein
VALTPDGRTALVAESAESTLTLASVADGSVTARIPVGSRPDGIAVDAAGRWAYVTGNGDNSVTVVDLEARRAVRTFAAGDGPSGVLLLP